MPISPAKLAELLGVAEDADEQTVETALQALRDKADAQQNPQPPAGTLEGGTTATDPATPAPDVEQLVAARVRDEVAKATQPILASLTSTTQELADIKAREAADVKRSVIASAVDKGKIAPASRADWERRYDEAPAVITEVLASIADGSAVPLVPLGHAGEPASSEDDALYTQLFGAAGAGV